MIGMIEVLGKNVCFGQQRLRLAKTGFCLDEKLLGHFEGVLNVSELLLEHRLFVLLQHLFELVCEEKCLNVISLSLANF